jgi:hypothetical protein
MSVHDLIVSELFQVLSHPQLSVVRTKPYVSRQFGWPGIRWVGELDGRLIYVSESRTTIASTPCALANLMMKSNARFDRRKDAIYFAHRRLGTGRRVEFRYRGRWFEVWSPDDTC